MTAVPAGQRLLAPPAETTVTSPSIGTPCSESFQPITWASDFIPALVSATDSNVPRHAIPVDTLL